MPRAALSNVSLKQLVAELKKRQAKLASLIKQRDALNEQIEELEGLADAGTAVAPPAPAPKAAKRREKARKKAAVKHRTKKRTFACPTCKQAFASGVALGAHYKAEPSHRAK